MLGVVVFNRNSSNKQHQSEHMLTIVWISADAVTADTANENAERCAALVEMLLNNTRLLLRIMFTFTCLWQWYW